VFWYNHQLYVRPAELADAEAKAGIERPILIHCVLETSQGVANLDGVDRSAEMLSHADFVSIHCPLTPETRGLFSEARLARMRAGSILVNTARGPIVDERALVNALAEGRIAGAGLDVFENEPRIEPGLAAMPNVVLTPHLGSAVAGLREAMAHVVVDNIAAVLEGRQPPNCCNPEIYAQEATP